MKNHDKITVSNKYKKIAYETTHCSVLTSVWLYTVGTTAVVLKRWYAHHSWYMGSPLWPVHCWVHSGGTRSLRTTGLDYSIESIYLYI